jgi:hypothetical protein
VLQIVHPIHVLGGIGHFTSIIHSEGERRRYAQQASLRGSMERFNWMVTVGMVGMVKDASWSPDRDGDSDLKKEMSLTIFNFNLEAISGRGSSTALASHFRPSSRRPVTGCHCARSDILINVTQTRDSGRRPAAGGGPNLKASACQ